MRIGDCRRSAVACSLAVVCLLTVGQSLLVGKLVEEGETASKKLLPAAAPEKGLEPGLQSCVARLTEVDLEAQLHCLRRLKEAGPAAAAATPTLCKILAGSDGATDHLFLACALDLLRSLGRDAAPAADTLSSLLPHRSKLYKDRDKLQVVRLRAYIVVTLGEIGVPSSALPALMDSLAHVDPRMMVVEAGAAARAVGSLGPRGHEFAPYLLSTLGEPFSEQEFSLERYEPQFSPHEATTIQLEAIRSLGKVCSARDQKVVKALRQLVEDRERGALDPRVVREAQNALESILARHVKTGVGQARR